MKNTRGRRRAPLGAAAFACATLLGACAHPQGPAVPGSGDVTQMVDGGALADVREVPKSKPLYPVDVGTLDPTAQRFCEALHAMPQARRAQCCSMPASAGLASECARALTTAVRDGSVVLDPQGIERCAGDTARGLDGCEWVTPILPAAPASCRTVVQGQLEVGARCRSSLECKEGLHCRGVGPNTAGSCAAPAAIGAACAVAVDTLATYTDPLGLEIHHPPCNGVCQGGRCGAAVAVGGACLSSGQCAPGAHCDAGHCASNPIVPVGKPCEVTGCEPGSTCASGRCIALKKAGESCTTPADCRGFCVKAPGAASGTCRMVCPGSPTASTSPSGSP